MELVILYNKALQFRSITISGWGNMQFVQEGNCKQTFNNFGILLAHYINKEIGIITAEYLLVYITVLTFSLTGKPSHFTESIRLHITPGSHK